MAYTKKGLGPTLKRNYDKVIFGIVILFLVGSVAFLLTSEKGIQDETDQFEGQIRSTLNAQHADLEPTNPEAFQKAAKSFETPFLLSTNKNFLVAQERVRCIKCSRPIPYEAEKCTHCGEPQPSEDGRRPGGDSDNDGLPDEYEEKYAFLNPLDPTDADQDFDGDSFTNLEEYKAGTNPSDPASHPSLVAFLRIRSMEEARIAYSLNGSVNAGAAGRKFQIKNTRTGQDIFTLLGQEINDPTPPDGGAKYKIISAIEKSEERDTPTGRRKVNFYVVTISNGSTQYTLVEREPYGTSGECRLTLVCARGADAKEVQAQSNLPFTFDGETFDVLKVDRERRSAIIRRNSDKKEFIVPRE